MTTSGSHERFSELIGPFLREELPQEDARALEEHLSTCGGCRAEVAALRALTAASGNLTEVERRDLHAEIKTALGEAPAAAVVPLSPRWATAAKALSAAAAVALIAAAGIWVGTSGTDDSGSDTAAGGGGSTAEAPAAESAKEGRPRPSFLGATPLAAQDSGDDEESENNGGDDATEQGVLSALELNQQLLANLAEEGPLFQDFAGYYSAPVPAETTQRTLLNLAKQAPGAGLRAQVEDCGDDFLASRPGTALSVAALLGNFEGEGALVIGFATTEDPSGPLNRYTYVIWRAGSCEAPLSLFGGALLR